MSVKVDDIEAVAYIFPNNYECYEEPLKARLKYCSYFRIPMEYNNYWYSIVFSGDAAIVSSEQNQILSTFKFLD